MAKKAPQKSPEEPTMEEIEAARLEREKRKKKGRDADPDPPVIVEVDTPDNDITSIREASEDDPMGTEETIIDNNRPTNEEDLNVDASNA